MSFKKSTYSLLAGFSLAFLLSTQSAYSLDKDEADDNGAAALVFAQTYENTSDVFHFVPTSDDYHEGEFDRKANGWHKTMRNVDPSIKKFTISLRGVSDPQKCLAEFVEAVKDNKPTTIAIRGPAEDLSAFEALAGTLVALQLNDTCTAPQSIAALVNLEVLNASVRGIQEGSDLSTLSGLTKLRVAKLDRNYILKGFVGLAGAPIEVLDLAHTNDDGNDFLGSISTLRKLKMGNFDLELLKPSLGALEELQVWGAMSNYGVLRGAAELKNLSISHCKDDSVLDFLDTLPSLKSVYCGQHNFSPEKLVAFKGRAHSFEVRF